jgi:hypothetical protein
MPQARASWNRYYFGQFYHEALIWGHHWQTLAQYCRPRVRDYRDVNLESLRADKTSQLCEHYSQGPEANNPALDYPLDLELYVAMPK